MGKIKKLWAKIAVVGLLATGLSFSGQVAFAEPAQAYTRTCYFIDAGYGYKIAGSPWPGYRYGVYCRSTYTWWEKVTWPWPQDHSWWAAFNHRPCEPNILYYVRPNVC